MAKAPGYELIFESLRGAHRVSHGPDAATLHRWAERCATWEPLAQIWVTADPEKIFYVREKTS